MQYKRKRENASKYRLHFNVNILGKLFTIFYIEMQCIEMHHNNYTDVLYADIIMNTIILLTHLFKISISFSFL